MLLPLLLRVNASHTYFSYNLLEKIRFLPGALTKSTPRLSTPPQPWIPPLPPELHQPRGEAALHLFLSLCLCVSVGNNPKTGHWQLLLRFYKQLPPPPARDFNTLLELP